MLDAKDLEMITEIVTKAVEKGTAAMKGEITDLQKDMTAVQKEVKNISLSLENDVKRIKDHLEIA